MTAQLKVGQNLVKPKAIHVFKDGGWQKKRMGYIYKNERWVPIINYEFWIFKEGDDFTSIPMKGDGKFSPNGHIYVQANSYDRGKSFSFNGIDFSEYDTLYIDIQTSAIQSTRGDFYIALPEGGAVYNVRLEPNRKIYEIDINDLTGYYDVGFVAINNAYEGSPVNAAVSLYNLWLE